MFIDLGLISWFCLDDRVFCFLVSLLYFFKVWWVGIVCFTCMLGWCVQSVGSEVWGCLMVLEAEERWSEGSSGGVHSSGEKTAACVLLQC